jgi:hypothetical protein
MKFRAIVKKSGDWWIGWLIDLPGVNDQSVHCHILFICAIECPITERNNEIYD